MAVRPARLYLPLTRQYDGRPRRRGGSASTQLPDPTKISRDGEMAEWSKAHPC